MIVDMHIHTRFSPCSSIRIAQLFKKVKQTGLDGICITDHDTTASCSILKNIQENSGILVLVGMEYTTDKGDFLIFGPLENIPKGMNAEGLLIWIRKEGGIAIPAHPFRKGRPTDLRLIQSSKVIESLNGRNNPHENELCRQWIHKYGNGVKQTGGSDAHTLEEVGQVVTVFNKDIYDVDDLIEELYCGHYSPLQRHSF
jgi:predicted metal-dependent phosphoesterase TrpH